MNNLVIAETRWMCYYQLLKDYNDQYGNIDVPDAFEINGIRLGSWLSRQRQSYKRKTLSINKIQLLNELNVDWNVKNTQYLNRIITNENKKEYNKILLKRVSNILEDMISKRIDTIDNSITQQEIENIIIKRLWR